MKNNLILAFLITCCQLNLFGQDFKKSTTLTLSKIDTVTLKLSNGNNSYKRTICLKGSNNKVLKEFVVNLESYSDEASSVKEITKTRLKDIDKIVKVNIEHCASYCNLDIYYYLVTNDNKWIELPLIEQADFDIGNTYQEYIFKEKNNTIINLVEFREKINENKPNKNNIVGYEIERIYEKKLKDLIWTGSELQGLEEEYIVTAKNGLILRDIPSLRSVKIGKINFETTISIIAKTKFTQTIIDKGKKIKGSWVKVMFESNPTQISKNAISNKIYGYVFDGDLKNK